MHTHTEHAHKVEKNCAAASPAAAVTAHRRGNSARQQSAGGASARGQSVGGGVRPGWVCGGAGGEVVTAADTTHLCLKCPGHVATNKLLAHNLLKALNNVLLFW